MYKILLIDDEPAILRLLDRIFYRHYDIICASSGEQALKLLKENLDIAVIVSDQLMPGLRGTDFLELAAKVCPQAVRIILTGYVDSKTLEEATDRGLIYTHITKPWSNENIRQVVAEAIENYEAAKESIELLRNVETG